MCKISILQSTNNPHKQKTVKEAFSELSIWIQVCVTCGDAYVVCVKLNSTQLPQSRIEITYRNKKVWRFSLNQPFSLETRLSTVYFEDNRYKMIFYLNGQFYHSKSHTEFYFTSRQFCDRKINRKSNNKDRLNIWCGRKMSSNENDLCQ